MAFAKKESSRNYNYSVQSAESDPMLRYMGFCIYYFFIILCMKKLLSTLRFHVFLIFYYLMQLEHFELLYASGWQGSKLVF
jgi:hypothetical protein